MLLGAEFLAPLAMLDQILGVLQSSRPEETMAESFGNKGSGGRVVATLAFWWIYLRIALPFSGSTQRWKTPVTLRLTSSLFTIV